MTAWRVWSASSADADVLAALESESFGRKSWGEKGVRASFTASGVSILLAGETPDAPRGFALWRDLGEDAELLTIGVAPASRKAGLGRALLRAVITTARSGGAEKIYLEVDKKNEAALALYERAGFRAIGVRKSYYRDGRDATVMSCRL
ncbi:ribosomal protein S18-alanine N-acetyltransferase [Hyphococcus sp.]|uniref:ribosomal protein S18-alanine N-acetyltransferase n=1 Tax=Hyphococcus sp. TaxID=2038636 RepID=UPI003CCBA230